MVTVYDTDFTNTLTGLFSSPFYTGTSATSAEVPEKYDVAFDGRGFMLDSAPAWRTIPTLRAQQDDREAAELSLNPEGLWRRSQSSWELGAGQVMYDDENSQRQRFRSSKGVDVWTPGRVTLLNDTELLDVVSPGADVVQVESTADHVYWADGQTVVRSDLTSQIDVTGTPATTITSMVSAGSYVLVGYTGNGVYKIAAGSGAASQYVTNAVTPSVVGWAKGRIIVCVDGSVYNPITAFTASAAALPSTATFVHPDAEFRWVGVAEGTSWIYLGGVSGDKSTIYRTIIRADGTELDVPTMAGRLPAGEILTSMYGYLGVLFLGTTKGFRVAAPNGNGDLVIGSLVDIGAAVYGMEGQHTFVYFGWSNYDAGSTGLGRIDLSNLTDEDNLVPAYASDLMASTQGTVYGIACLNDTLVFGVNGVGAYKQATTLVESGEIRTGILRYGITEEKVVTGARASVTGSGIATLELSVDGGTFASIGVDGAQERGIDYEVRTTLTRVGAESPTLASMTLYSYPAPKGTMFIDLAVIINEQVQTAQGIEQHMDIERTLDFIRDRWLTKVLVTLQVGAQTFQATLEQWKFDASHPAEEQRGAWNGIAPLSWKVIQ